MVHPLANDPGTPEIIRKLFARVTHVVICKFDDGHESQMNCMSYEAAELQAADRYDILAAGGGRYRSRVGPTYETKMVSVEIREI